MRMLLLAIFALLALTSPASAAPIVGAVVAAVGSFVAGITLKSVVMMALKLALRAGVSLLLQKYRQRKQRPAGIQTSVTTFGGTDPQGTIVGLYATAGHLTYRNSHGANKRFLTHVIEVSDIPGVQFNRLIIDGEYSEIGTTEQADYGWPILSKNDGTYDRGWLRFVDGTHTGANAKLVAQYGEDPDRPWTTNHILTGVAHFILTFDQHRPTYRNGVPQVRFEMIGIPFYDPRLDDTVGGTGTHRWADTTTWATTTNPIVIAYNIKRGITLPSGEVWGGNAEAEDLPLDSWSPAMNACDQMVGTPARKRFQCGFEIRFNEEPADVLEEIYASANAQVAELGGVWRVQVGAPAASIMQITDADIIVTKPQQFDPFPGAEATFNAISVTHPSRPALWNATGLGTITNAQWEADDGERNLFELKLPAVPWRRQARQMARSLIRDQRRFRSHAHTLPPDYFQLEPLDAVDWASVWNGYSAKAFGITQVAYDLRTLTIGISSREHDPSDYSFDETLDLAEPPQVTGPLVVVDAGVPGFAVAAVKMLDGAGKARRVGIRAIWSTSIADTVDGIALQLRLLGETDLAESATISEVEGAKYTFSPLLPVTDYEVRAKAVAKTRKTNWSAWLSVTTDNVGLSPEDLASEVWTQIGNDAATTASGLITTYDTDTMAPFQAAVVGAYGSLTQATPLDTRIGATEATALVLGGTVQGNIDDIDRIETDLTVNLPVVQGSEQAIDTLNERLIEMTLAQRDLGTKMADAGIYVDPDTGTIRLEATARIDDGLALLTLGLDAVAAEITTRVTYSTLTDVVAAAALDPTALLDFTDITGRVSAVEVVQNGLDARFAASSITATVTQQGLTLTQAELDIDSLNAAMALRVTTETFGAVETRVSQAEQTLDTMDGARLAQSVLDVNAARDDLDNLAEKSISDLLAARIDNQDWRADLAYARQDLVAIADDNGAAIASVSTEIGVFKTDTAAQFKSEALTRAADDAALSQQITSLIAVTDQQTVSLDEINRVEADSASGNARALSQLQIDVNGAGGVAQAVTALEGRVDTTEDGLVVSTSERTSLFAGLGDAEDLAAEGGLRALLEGREAKRLAQSGLAQAREDLSAQVAEDVSAEAAKRVELDAVLKDATARLDRDLAVLATDGSATAQSLLALGVTVDGVDLKAESMLQLVATDTTAFGQWYKLIDGDVYDQETGLAKTRGQVDDIVNFNLDETSALFNKLSGVSTEVFGADGNSGLKASSALRQTSIDGIKAGFSLAINNNGHISGITATSDLADGVNASSDLLFAADKMFFMGEIYAVGTVNVTNGSKNITGATTLWSANAAASDWFTGPDGRSYQIAAVSSNTTLTLVKNYQGQTETSATYGIAKGNPLLSVYTVDTLVDGTLIPKGVYLNDAMIRKAVIGRAQITDTLESDNYAEDAGGVPMQGVKIDFKNDVMKLAGPVISRNIVLNEGQFSVTGNMVNGTEYLFVNSGIRMGKDDVWAVTNDTFIAVATVTSGATGPGGLDGNNAFWGLTTRLSSGARWFGYPGTAPTLNYRKDPATIVNMPGKTGTDQRLFFHIKLQSTGGVYFVNPTIKWKIFRVT